MTDQNSFFHMIRGPQETVADAGEDGVLELVKKVFPDYLIKPDGVSIPTFGDDAAVFGRGLLSVDEELVVTGDVLVEGADFLFDWMSYYDLGYKSLMVNLSDLAAMGAEPLGMIVVIGLQDKTPLIQIEAFLEGMAEVSVSYDVILLGGDLSESDVFFCNVTLLGKVPEGKALTRAGVRNGDCVAVTGSPGESRAGLMIALNQVSNVTSEEKVFLNPFFKPQARIQAGLILRESAGIRGCIDLSDGIARDSLRIAKRNSLRIEIQAELLPASAGLINFWKSRGKNPFREIATGGEDFELMFCCDPDNLADIKNSIAQYTGLQTNRIGRVIEGEGAALVMSDGSRNEMTAWGFDHFEKSRDDT